MTVDWLDSDATRNALSALERQECGVEDTIIVLKQLRPPQPVDRISEYSDALDKVQEDRDQSGRLILRLTNDNTKLQNQVEVLRSLLLDLVRR